MVIDTLTLEEKYIIPQVCDICGFTFKNYFSLRKHLRFGCKYKGFRSLKEAQVYWNRYKSHQAYCKKREYILENQRKYRKTLNGKLVSARKNKKAILKHFDRYLARNLLHSYVLTGKIIKKPCQICGDIKTQAHHTDYNKPLNVQWLCFNHHFEADGRRSKYDNR